MVAVIYIVRPPRMSPLLLIGIKIFRVIGWHTKMAALMPPTHAMPRTRKPAAGMADSILIKATWATTTKKGTISHVQKLKERSIIAATAIIK